MPDLDEEQLDNFIAKTTQAEEPTTQPQTDEEIVEKQARGKPTKTTVLQRRTELDEAKLERRIEQILARNAGKIDEADLRERIAEKIDANGRVTEADLVLIRDSLLREYDAAQEAAEAEENKPLQEQIADSVVGKKPIFRGKQPTADKLQKNLHSMADWATGLKTPGGVGILVFALLFFIWVIVPVSNGQTRLQLLWQVLTGQADFRQDVVQQEEQAVSQSEESAYGGQAIGDYGSGGIGGGTIVQFPSFEVEF